MNLNKCLLTKNDCYKAGRTIKPTGIVVHSTGANNKTIKRYVQPDDGKLGKNTNGNDWNHSGVNKCVHAFIGTLADGSIATYQTLPWNYRCWGCGSGSKGSYNDTHIQFEICEDNLGDKTYFQKVYKEAVELCVYLCNKYNIKTSAIVCHKEAYNKGYASNHGDVLHWFPKHGKSMDDFRKDVQAKISNTNAPVSTSYPEPTRVIYYEKKVTCTGEDVKWVQEKLKSKGYNVTIDGSFGPASDTALRAFQKDSKLTVDGKCGSNTRAALKKNSVTEFKVKIDTNTLNVRSGAGESYSIVTTVKRGEVYTILEEKDGWGKLKSGAGWISLKYTIKN